MGTGNFILKKKTKFFSGLKIQVPRVPPITTYKSPHCLPPYLNLLNRGSYMSAHVLLNLLNELGKRDKMRGLPSILSLFRNEFNKCNNTRARMLDSIYHMTNTLKSHFWRKNVIILSLCTQRCYGRHNVSRKSINH